MLKTWSEDGRRDHWKVSRLWGSDLINVEIPHGFRVKQHCWRVGGRRGVWLEEGSHRVYL